MDALLRRIAFAVSAMAVSGCAHTACACPEMPCTGCSPVTAAPSSIAFALDDNTPQTVTVKSDFGTLGALIVSINDPSVIGVSTPVVSGSSATFSVIPVARGATFISASVGGPVASINVKTASCGRPPTLVAEQQVVPAPGATSVPRAVGTAYFVAYYATGAPVSGALHLIAGGNATLEGGTLVNATLPPGVALPPPIPLPNANGVVVKATVPTLAAGLTYKTELYNDTCQPPLIAGSFST